MMYELLGGREAHMRNVMSNFNSDGDFVGPGGVVVPGMYHGRDGEVDRSTWQQLIDVSDDARQKMFDNVKREFIQELLLRPYTLCFQCSCPYNWHYLFQIH